MIYSGIYKVTSPFGNRVLDGVLEHHPGIDVVGITDKHICAVASGVVGASTIITDPSNRTSEWGNYVRIDGDDGMHYYYCHMNQRLVSAGQRIKAGEHIGVEGWTGKCRPIGPGGQHCHFEVRDAYGNSVNPAPYLGIANAVGTYGRDYRTEAQRRFGWSEKTMRHFDSYEYAADVYRKMVEAK